MKKIASDDFRVPAGKEVSLHRGPRKPSPPEGEGSLFAGFEAKPARGIRPAIWWEKGRAVKATLIAIRLWAVLLAALGGMIVLLRRF